jgi:hypothetical protein
MFIAGVAKTCVPFSPDSARDPEAMLTGQSARRTQSSPFRLTQYNDDRQSRVTDRIVT